ncbi:class I SAM-dependent methyltransferase [Geomicrobium sp. JSM 1781026]|uniref:class I SAM-dependent methyltransferase n=1 Tax=Geomicrobium sp. JSM 1781026 TaxID=3344580 RepID=UPI0035BFFA9B
MIPLVYDQINQWGKHDEFFLQLLKKVQPKKVADVGCGTGRFTIHLAKAGHDVTAIDPNAEAIALAKEKEHAAEISWMIGDSATLPSKMFDAVIMTANVAQVFLTDKSWQQTLADVYRSLKPGGYFLFDTRNPSAKAWEVWEQDQTPDRAVDEATGDQLEIWTAYDGFVDGVYTFYETVKHVKTDEILVHEKMQLIFRTEEEITHSLEQAGFAQVQVYGDFDWKAAGVETKAFVFHSIK